MVNVYTNLGSIGASKIIERSFWFNNIDRQCSQLDQTFSVPNGNYLFTWSGVLRADSNRIGSIIVNGVSTGFIRSSGSTESIVGGYLKIATTSSMKLTGTGNARFMADPTIMLIRV